MVCRSSGVIIVCMCCLWRVLFVVGCCVLCSQVLCGIVCRFWGYGGSMLRVLGRHILLGLVWGHSGWFLFISWVICVNTVFSVYVSHPTWVEWAMCWGVVLMYIVVR